MTRLLTMLLPEDVLPTLLAVKLRRWPTSNSNSSTRNSNRIILHQPTRPTIQLSCPQPQEWLLPSKTSIISLRKRKAKRPTPTLLVFTSKPHLINHRLFRAQEHHPLNTLLSTRHHQLLRAVENIKHISLPQAECLHRTLRLFTDKRVVHLCEM